MTKKKETALHKKLAGELSGLIPSLDEEGLAFLVEQARVHLYNMDVDRLEAERIEAETKNPALKGSPTRKSAGTSPAANFRIERSSSGSSYHLISGGKWKMFNEEEMLSIVQIAQSKDPVLEVAERLCRWFETERPDTFADLELGDQFDPRMKELVTFLRAKFAVKKA